jgi:hypothetical protein
VIKCDFSPEGKKQYWIWLSLWTRVFKSSSLVVDKVDTFYLSASIFICRYFGYGFLDYELFSHCFGVQFGCLG